MDDSIKEVKDSFSEELTETRNILIEMVYTKVPMEGHTVMKMTMEITQQELLPATIIPRKKPASLELGWIHRDNSES